MDLEKEEKVARRGNWFPLRVIVTIVALTVLGKGAQWVETEVKNIWSDYKLNMIVTEVNESLRGKELIVDPRGMQKKLISQMSKEDLLMANFMLRVQVDACYGNMGSIKQLSDVTPMF